MTAFSPEVRELLTVIRDALDLPYAATPDGSRERQELRNDNAIRVMSTVSYLLDASHPDIASAATVLREMLDKNPVTYATKAGEGQ
ncbi:hypothetical protein [Spirillospora sp. CA-128828]|uniref:hypothetical protein n=1 Tax=Spirillospora sp. CA-128828 TaxID=3240033 RepID=UPI003D90C91E